MSVQNSTVRATLHGIMTNRGGVQHSATSVVHNRESVLNGWRVTVPYLRDIEADMDAWRIDRVTTFYGMYSFPTRQAARRARDELYRLGFAASVHKPIEGTHSHV